MLGKDLTLMPFLILFAIFAIATLAIYAINYGICRRCDGNGFIETGKQSYTCPKCKGTGNN